MFVFKKVPGVVKCSVCLKAYDNWHGSGFRASRKPGSDSAESIPCQETILRRVFLARKRLCGEYSLPGNYAWVKWTALWKVSGQFGSAFLVRNRPVWRVFGQFSTILLASGLLCFPLRSFMGRFLPAKKQNRGLSAPRNDY